jgi:hypothetical protein
VTRCTTRMRCAIRHTGDRATGSFMRTPLLAMTLAATALVLTPKSDAQEVKELHFGGAALRQGMSKDEVLNRFKAQNCGITVLEDSPPDQGEDYIVGVTCKDSSGATSGGTIGFTGGKLSSAEKHWATIYGSDNSSKKLFDTLMGVILNQNNMGLLTGSIQATHRSYPEGGYEDSILIQFLTVGRYVEIHRLVGFKSSTGAAVDGVSVSEGID